MNSNAAQDLWWAYGTPPFTIHLQLSGIDLLFVYVGTAAVRFLVVEHIFLVAVTFSCVPRDLLLPQRDGESGHAGLWCLWCIADSIDRLDDITLSETYGLNFDEELMNNTILLRPRRISCSARPPAFHRVAIRGYLWKSRVFTHYLSSLV